MPDLEEDFDDRYVLYSSGGCVICDGMDGMTFPGEPYRPHPNCNCTIMDRSGLHGDCDEARMAYRLDYSHPIYHSDEFDPDDEFDLFYDYEITCPDGETLSGQVLVSVTFGEQDEDFLTDVEDNYAEALKLVEEIAASECASCPEPKPIV